MAAHNHNVYLSYKRDTNLLLYWIIRKFNDVITSLPEEEKSKSPPNVTGQTTVAGLLSMSKLIASSVSGSTVPAAVYWLFRSVIDKRTSAWQTFQAMTAANPDPDVEKSNQSHKFFIDALQEAFELLGGKNWALSQSASQAAAGSVEEEIKQALFANKFSSLAVDPDTQDRSEDDFASETEAAPTKRQQQPRPGKGKKGKKKAGKKQVKKTARVKEADLDDVPLESYRIMEDEVGIMTDYLMAVYGLVQEWADLRNYLQDMWMDVAYNGLNSAVAGTVSNLAVSMLRRSELAIFAQFPGHEPFETVMKTITRGDPEKVKTNFSLQLVKYDPDGKTTRGEKTYIDVKETFLIHVYEDFMDFVNDFRHNRNGKPTKSMAAQIGNWHPDFDLQHATKEQRIKWRRAYTINWLYDLVNLFSSIVVQRNTLRGQNWDLSKVDWSPRGPWAKHIRLFGLNEFAGFVCSLAWQKQGVDVSKKILPHHMLQLQCIVDSMTVSRGWSLSSLKGHVLRSPAAGFRPRRDVDLFLDREHKNWGSGFLQAANVYAQAVEKSNDSMDCKATADVVRDVLDDFREWLGESKYMHGLNTIPPSRFSSTTANGLWEYSPFLCGVGLAEGLDISYRLGMVIWDRLPESIMAIHLHNMLVEKGYIRQPVGLYTALASYFPECFFAGGKAPTSDFAAAMTWRIYEARASHRSQTLRAQQVIRQDPNDLRKIIGVDLNNYFTKKSNLGLYHDADWNVEQIPDSDITTMSTLAFMRLSQVRQYTDETGRKRLEETELVRRHLSGGYAENPLTMDELVQMVDGWRQMVSVLKANETEVPQQMEDLNNKAQDFKGYKTMSRSDMRARLDLSGDRNGLDTYWQGSNLLQLLQMDIYADICGHNPISSLNYIGVAVRFFMYFDTVEEELRAVNNKVYRTAFPNGKEKNRAKRIQLVSFAMESQDEECLRIMARGFENPRAGFMSHIFWEDLDTDLHSIKRKTLKSSDEPACVVM